MGTTPLYAIPYVDPSSVVADFPAADRAQAEAVEAALDVGPARAARLKNSSQSLTAGAWLTALYDVDEGSKDVPYASGNFTLTKAGLWQFNLQQHFQLSSGSGNMALRLLVNGSVLSIMMQVTSAAVSISIPHAHRLLAGDVIRVEGNCSVAGGTLYGSSTRYSYFDCYRVSS